MSNGRLKAALIISLAFNIAVVGALTYGLAGRASTRYRGRFSMDDRIPSFERRSRHFARRMGLPGEKAGRFGEIMGTSSEEALELGERLQSSRRELMELLRDGETGEEELMAKVEEISSVQGELEKLVVKRLLLARSLLDDEEYGRFLGHIRRGMNHRRRGPGMRPGRNAPGREGRR